MDRGTVSHWANHFRGGCVSIGRPRTSTDKRSVKLVADALDEDHLATCEVLSRAGVFNPQPAGHLRPSDKFCAAREGYFTVYNAL